MSEERPRLVVVYLAGLLALWFVLAGIRPVFFSLLLVLYPLVLYPQVFRHLRLSLAIPAAIALTAVGHLARRAGVGPAAVGELGGGHHRSDVGAVRHPVRVLDHPHHRAELRGAGS